MDSSFKELVKPSLSKIFTLDSEVQELVSKFPLYDGFSKIELKVIENFLEEKRYNTNEYVILEKELEKDVYFILEGKVEVLKKADNFHKEIHLKDLSVGDTFGELAMLDSQPRSASIRTVETTRLLILSEASLELLDENEPIIYNKIVKNISKNLGNQIRQITKNVITDYEISLEKEKQLTGMCNLFCYSFFIFSFYNYFLKFSADFMNNKLDTNLLTCFFAILSGACFATMMKQSEYPMSLYGFTKKNYKKYFIEGFLWTLPLVFSLIFAKLLYIYLIDSSMPFISINIIGKYSFAKTIWLSIIYFLLIPLQEIVFRGGIQGSLHYFFKGPRANILAIIVSTVAFSLAHLHISIYLSLLTLFPGLCWAFMFHKQRSLVGVIFSHILVGLTAILVLPGF